MARAWKGVWQGRGLVRHGLRQFGVSYLHKVLKDDGIIVSGSSTQHSLLLSIDITVL